MKVNNKKYYPAAKDPLRWQKYVVDRSVRNENGCWIWQRRVCRNSGYGLGSIERLPVIAHRISYFAHKGIPSSGKIILHNCHVKTCVNPNHLREGTIRENILDAIAVGAAKQIPLSKSIHRGEAHGRAKLTEAQVLEIRRLKQMGLYAREIAKLVGATRITVSNITTRRTWKHI